MLQENFYRVRAPHAWTLLTCTVFMCVALPKLPYSHVHGLRTQIEMDTLHMGAVCIWILPTCMAIHVCGSTRAPLISCACARM